MADHARKALYAMLALALIGIGDAFYDSYAIYSGQLLWCPPPIDGCNIVADSTYARIVDGPVSIGYAIGEAGGERGDAFRVVCEQPPGSIASATKSTIVPAGQISYHAVSAPNAGKIIAFST